MGSNRRRRRRGRGASTGGGQPPRDGAPPQGGWRETIDSWGGLPVIGSLAIALLVVVTLVVVNLPGGDAGDREWVPADRTQVDGRVTGDPTAPVRIVEFADYQCPHCRRFAEETEPILYEEFIATGVATLELHYFPFIGDESFAAAEAAECAAEQNRFWDYHDILFLRQGSGADRGTYSTSNLQEFAQELHNSFPDFDTAAFDDCVDSGRHGTTVEALAAEARALGVSSTPSFLINGVLFENSDIESFRAAIEAAAGG